MKKISIIASAAAMLFSSAASGQVLFKVEKQGSDKVSYVLGTHHFAPLSAVDSIPELPSIIRNADKVYGEIDMNSMGNPETIMAIQKQAMAPSDSTLSLLLTPAQIDSLTTTWTKYGNDENQLKMMIPMVKPAVISTQLAASMAARVLPSLNPMEGIDATMQTRAREAGKQVEGLETMEYQLGIIYGQPISEQLESLMNTVADEENEGRKAIELANAYTSHDIQKLYDLIAEEEDNNPETLERILFHRNDNWVKILKAELPEKSLMVVVGAGHLPGERGILESLRKAGYTITPVN